MSGDSEKAKSYFDQLAPEYDRAFRKSGQSLGSTIINRSFRGPTFARRMRMLESLFAELGMAGKHVLDLGCGSGQVAILAARMGARVHAIDIAPGMLQIARETATAAGVADRIVFEDGDVSRATLPPADIGLLIGVVEYYADYQSLIGRAAAACRETLLIAHTRRVLYRMLLRKLMFRAQGASVYFHPMAAVAAAAATAGMPLQREIVDAGFSLLVHRRG